MRAVALRYALAPACVLLAVLVYLLPANLAVPLAGLFVFAVLAAAWFGGAGPGFLAALLSSLALPQLVALDYPLVGGFLDFPRFITFSIAGLAVGRWSFRRRQVEAALRESEKRYELAMNASNEGFWDWIAATDTVYASPRLLEIYGFAPGTTFAGREELVARIPFHPEDRSLFEQAIARHFADKKARFDIEMRFIRNGETRWVALTGMAARDPSGEVARWTGTVRDVTGQKSAQDALRESEARFRALTELSADWYWRQDEELRFTYASQQVADSGSYRRELVVGKTRWELPGITPLSSAWDDHRAALKARLPFRDLEFAREGTNGRVEYVSISGAPIFDAQGEFRGYHGVGRNITARKRAEEALRSSEHRYALAMEAAGDGHTDWDLVSGEFYVSPRLLQILGYSPATTFVDRADWVRRFPFHPEDRRKWEKAIAAHFAGPKARFNMDLRIVVDGETRWVRFTFIATRDATGKPVRWTGSIADINDAKLAEQALRESEERYQRVVAATRAGFWDWDVVQDKYYVSPRLLEMAGLPPGTVIASRADFQARVPLHPEDLEKWQREIRALFESGGSRLSTELRVVFGAETRWYRLDGMCFRDASGRVVRWTGSSIDVTARKRVEEALRESEQRYELAMAASESGYWDWDIPSGRYFVSPKAYELGGYEPGTTWVGRDDFQARINMHPEDFARWEAARQELFAGTGERLSMEVRYIVRGETRWHMLNAICRRDHAGKVVRWTGSATDVTARKLAEEALRESEARKSAMFETALDCIISIDHDGRVVEFNSAAERTFGYRRSEAMGKELAELIIPARLRERHRRGLAHYLATGRGRMLGTRVEMPAVRADGAEFQVELSVARIAAEGPPLFTAYLRDITERKRGEEMLRESEARFRALTELSSDWYWKQDEHLRFTYMSNHAAALGGYAADSSQGKAWWEVEGLGPLSASWAEHQAVTAARQPFRDLELRRVMPDGSISYHSISGAPVFDERGRFSGYQGVGRNITERKRIEEELRSRQEMLELAQKSAQAIAFEWRIRGTDRNRWSPELAAMYGITPEAYDGSPRQWKKLVHPGDWPALREAIKHAHRTGEFSVEHRVVHPDGSVHWLQARGRMFFDTEGKPVRLVGFMHDVTQRRHAEEALRLSEERHALAVASADEGIFDWDLRSDRVYVSQRAQELFGLSVGDLWGPRRRWREILNFHPEDSQLQRDSIRALIAGETSTYDVEFRVIFPDGSVRWFRQRAVALRDAAGKAYRMVGSIGDITERKRAQEELQGLERQLRQAQRLEAMGTLAGGIAHDFNNLLGAILGYGEMALRDAPKGSRLARDLDSIIVAGERGRALVDRVLAFSRSAVGERVAVHVEKVVREALDLVSAKLPPDIELQCTLCAGRAAIVGDATQVHQVLMNLATNAVQAMPEGGTLRVSLEVSRADASRVPTLGVLAPASEYLVLRVADTGTGILPDILERIFDPFFTTKEVGTGTGLGLSLVHGIVSELGGAIDVTSTPGAGSTFTVYLPRSGDAVEAREDEEPEIPRGGGQRVLIVDDEEPLVRLATRTLEELGYMAVGFTSSTAALAAFRADPQRFDALITDERMPGMSGSALIREVRGIRGGMPIVLMSGYVGGSVTRRARNAGAEEILKKPLSARDLATSLARVLRL